MFARQSLYYLRHTPALFALVILGIGSPIYGLDLDLPIFASCIAGMTGPCHQAQLLLEVGSGLELSSSLSLPSE
jgi:hypothetical protein